MKKREGFTLISVMVAVVLLTVGVMALAKTQFTVAQITNRQAMREQSLQLASEYLEQVRGRDPWSLATEPAATVDSTGAVNAAGKFTRAMTVTDQGAQLEGITLTLVPKYGVNPTTVTINTFIFKVAR